MRPKHGALALGVVRLDGQIEANSGSMRAERAEILALASDPDGENDATAQVTAIADAMDVDVVDFAELSETGARYGAPLPRWLRSPAACLSLPVRETTGPPAFRFWFSGTSGSVTPWGYPGANEPPERLSDRWWGALGEIFALDPHRALACFAAVSPDARTRAEEALRSWADLDCWELTIAPGTLSLSRPSSPPRVRGPVCQTCWKRKYVGYFTNLAFGSRGYVPTICEYCGGRLSWFPTGRLWKRRSRARSLTELLDQL
jgi:hypothetical protein